MAQKINLEGQKNPVGGMISQINGRPKPSNTLFWGREAACKRDSNADFNLSGVCFPICLSIFNQIYITLYDC